MDLLTFRQVRAPQLKDSRTVSGGKHSTGSIVHSGGGGCLEGYSADEHKRSSRPSSATSSAYRQVGLEVVANDRPMVKSWRELEWLNWNPSGARKSRVRPRVQKAGDTCGFLAKESPRRRSFVYRSRRGHVVRGRGDGDVFCGGRRGAPIRQLGIAGGINAAAF